jgi:hypothetical protein
MVIFDDVRPVQPWRLWQSQGMKLHGAWPGNRSWVGEHEFRQPNYNKLKCILIWDSFLRLFFYELSSCVCSTGALCGYKGGTHTPVRQHSEKITVRKWKKAILYWSNEIEYSVFSVGKKLGGDTNDTFSKNLREHLLVLHEPPRETPRARSHLHSIGPHLSHASFTIQSSYLHLRGSYSSLGTNVTIPGHLSQLVGL